MTTGTEVGPKVILSFGIGRLHFVQAAEVLVQEGVDLTVLQGWVPGCWLTDGSIDWLGRLVGSPQLSVGMNLRRMPFLSSKRNVGLAWAEFFTQALFAANRTLGLARGTAARIGWSAFGRASQRHLSGHDIFHVRSGAGAGGAIAEAKKRGLKVIVDHSIAHPANLEAALQSEFEAAGLPFWTSPDDPFWNQVLTDCLQADLLLVNSDFVKATFVDQGVDPDRIEVIYLGVRQDFSDLKQDYSLGGDTLNLLFTGQFGIRKGARYLIDALERLAAEGILFRLTVLGDISEVQDLLKRSSIADSVETPGFIPQGALKSYLAEADLYVFPSLAEGCASSAMEALAAGLPVVATAETGLPVRHDEHAWIVPPKDPAALYDALVLLAGDEAMRRRLGQTAATLMSCRYTWSDYGRNVAELYKRVLSGGEHGDS